MPVPSDQECGNVNSPAAGFLQAQEPARAYRAPQGRRAHDTVFVEVSPIFITNKCQTTELPWIQLGFSSSGV